MILDLEQTKMHTVKLLPGIHNTSGVTQHMLFDNDGIKLSVKVSLLLTSRAGKSTQLVYLSKSTSNSEKSYSSTSKSTQKKLYLKYK